MEIDQTELVRLADAILCDEDGCTDAAYTALKTLFGGDRHVYEILVNDVNATDGRFYLPSDHVGIENTLRRGC